MFREAGITTVMITGDHRDTALAIAKDLGIAEREEQCMSGDELDELPQEELNRRIGGLRLFAPVSYTHLHRSARSQPAQPGVGGPPHCQPAGWPAYRSGGQDRPPITAHTAGMGVFDA